MADQGNIIGVDLDNTHLSAVMASVGREQVNIDKWLEAKRPDSVDPAEAKAVGEWIGEELRKAGINRGRVVFSVPRGDVVLKRFVLPAGADSTEADLAGMVHLQMSRQLTVGLEGTAIDYMATGESSEAGGTRPVLAGALPGDRLKWLQEVAKAAGLKIERLGIRSAGAAALLAAVSQRHEGSLLVIWLGWTSAEFTVVENGQPVFARATDMPRPGRETTADASYAQRVAVEAKRTWMSYRMSRESADIEAVAILSETELGELVAERCSEALEMQAEQVGYPKSVYLPRNMEPVDRSVMAPLIGLVAERVIATPTLDFANPRKAPDLAAGKRQRVLLSAFAMIVICGLSYVFASGELAKLEGQVAQAERHDKQRRLEVVEFLREDARLEHVQHWMEIDVDWLAHLHWLSEQMPDPHKAQLEQIHGSLEAAVQFEPKDDKRKYLDGKWRHGQLASFSLDARVRDRAVANDFRARLLASNLYEVDNKGADVPKRFGFSLKTSRSSPVESPSESSSTKDGES